jgi:hypothetical protein
MLEKTEEALATLGTHPAMSCKQKELTNVS